MGANVIVENVSKKYTRNSFSHLSYGLSDLFDELSGRKRPGTLRKDEFWSVKGVNFEMQKGDSLALLGRNGSGKTTLLKMLHGLIKPDSGRIIMNGTVQALINLQAGFNANLSGRDNVYNLAALLGFGKRETDAMINEVMRFSELEAFMDSPVGTYSSGMKARLGFSLAIGLEPDILLIDEVLAVGDHAFQNKCHHRMQQLKKSGVTLLFVTHSHTHALQLCDKALWMHEGVAEAFGPTKDTIEAYLSYLEDEASQHPINLSGEEAFLHRAPSKKMEHSLFGAVHPGDGRLENLNVSLFLDDTASDRFPVHSPMEIRYSFSLLSKVEGLNVSLSVFRNDGLLLSTISTLKNGELDDIKSGDVKCSATIKDMDLVPGAYMLVMSVHEGHSYLFRDVVRQFQVIGGGGLFWGVKEFSVDYRVDR